MFCRFCGKQIGDSDSFCMFCGKSTLADIGSDPFEEYKPTDSVNLGPEPKPAEPTVRKQPDPIPPSPIPPAPQEQKSYLVNNNDQQLFGQQYYYPEPVKKSVNGFAIAGFVIALVAFALDFLGLASESDISSGITLGVPYIISLALSIVGVVKSKKLNSGKAMGITGIVLSALGFVFWAAIWVTAIVLLLSLGTIY